MSGPKSFEYASAEIVLGTHWFVEGKNVVRQQSSEYLYSFDYLQRSPWRRCRSHPMNQSNPRPLQPVSEVTKNKLSKFHYQPRDEDSKEQGVKAESSTTNVLSSVDDFEKTTATPVNRLTWKDFMEPGATGREEDVHISPSERIMWDNNPDNLYAGALSPMMPRKSRKRARSSSPTSSPANENPTTPAVNVKKLAQALRSPHADPTLELWDRYSLTNQTNMHTTPLGLANPTLAQLMISSSPRPPKDVSAKQGRGGLRRTVSHGLGGVKRRKIEKTSSCGGGSNSQREMEAASKSSLVTQLLDSVNSSMQEPSTLDPPSASASLKKPKSFAEDSTPCKAPAETKISADISDYGDDDFDDDFDDDTFIELEATINGTQAAIELETTRQTTKSVPTDSYDERAANVGRSKTIAGGPQSSEMQTTTTLKQVTAIGLSGKESELDDLDDEFGDLDDGNIDFDAIELQATQSVEQAQCSQAVRLTGNQNETSLLS